MIPEGKDASAVTPEITKEVIRRVQSYKREKKLTFDQIARGIGKAESVISQVIKGNYAGDTRSVILDLDRWLDDQVKIDLAPKPASFVWTSVAREIETIARATVELRTIGLVYGPETSGLGKTTALQAIASERPGCIFITIDKVEATTGGILSQFSKQLRIPHLYNHAHSFRRVCDALAGTSRLLIVDQVHNLCGSRKDKPFYVLADLHERTKAPQLWAGTSDVVAYLKRGQAKGEEPLSQIRSRIGIQRDLTQRTRVAGGGPNGPASHSDKQLFTIDEIKKIFSQNKMRLSHDALMYLLRIANLRDSGALRTCKNLVVMATKLYEAKHDNLSADLIRQAHQLLVTDESFNLLQAEIEEAAGTRTLQKVG